jgi:rhodanese-related sulfurtransferase
MKKTIIGMLLVLGLSGAAASAGECDDESRYPNVEREELAGLVERKEAFIIDVNSKDSFAKARVPGAIHYGTAGKNFAKMLPEKKDTLIVAYCGGPSCTAWKKAAKEACGLGYTNIKHFKGGIKGWTKSS